MFLNWKVCLNWIEQHPTLFSALSSVGALLSAIFSFRSIKQTLNLRNEDRIEAAKLRREDRIEAAKFRREDREKFETELANAVDIAKSTKQQAISMEKLATVLEKQLEILEEKKLRVIPQNSWMCDNPNGIGLLINISLNITNPTKQTIKINSISINDNSPFIFISACYRELVYFPHSLGTLRHIHPKQAKYLCLQRPKVTPPIYGNIDPFSLKPSCTLVLILTVFPKDKNTKIPLIFTMEHTAIDPLNPSEKVNFCPEYFYDFKPESKLLQAFNSSLYGFPR
ncbi:hypothetical protein [Bartonella queenslandensis]|uniref:hypothetical protein n=1 Tax=Bartonella queenslandensis TaxID=481138 RepID=UPI001BA818B8|nr:hypothetical protein [Bartonella queenslandensis]